MWLWERREELEVFIDANFVNVLKSLDIIIDFLVGEKKGGFILLFWLFLKMGLVRRAYGGSCGTWVGWNIILAVDLDYWFYGWCRFIDIDLLSNISPYQTPQHISR